MIRSFVDFALNNRFIVLSVAVVLFAWGIVSFKRLPVEAYPDVANTWVQVITQWPGRAAEEVEQQITIPIEIQMNGIPHLVHVRSASLAGLSVVNLIFDDNSDNDWDRQKVLERLSAVTLPPNGRGRDADRSAPPAQTRAGAFNAHGSYLGYLAAKRSVGYGCRMQTSGSRPPSRARKRSQVQQLR